MGKITPPGVMSVRAAVRRMIERIDDEESEITVDELTEKIESCGLEIPKTPKKHTPYVCPCCGAPLKSSTCDYCGVAVG